MSDVDGGKVSIRTTYRHPLREVLRRYARGIRRAIRLALAERQVLLRSSGRVRAVTFGPTSQLACIFIVLGLIGWTVHATVARFESGHVIAAKEREIGALKLAYRSLESEVGQSADRFQAMARTLDAKNAYLVTLLDGAAQPVPEGRAEDGLGRAELQRLRRDVLAELGKLEITLQGTAFSEGRTRRDLLSVERRLQLSTTERARLDRQRRDLVSRLDRLENRLAEINLAQRSVVVRMADRAQERVQTIKGLIAATGVDLDKLLARIQDDAAGLGGPFIAAGPDDAVARAMPASLGVLDLNLDRLDDVRKLAQVLPLASPSDHFYVASGFGKRRDPLNKRWAMHYGVDLAGVPGSPILATAPGTVVFAGWNGNYGRMVEIDHGMGLRTRYGHLRRITVKKADTVDLRQKVGEMGSTGRSTGTHLHYEILVDGKPRNPVNFMQAGEHVLKGF